MEADIANKLKVQGKKQRDTAKQDAELLAKKHAAEKAGQTSDKENTTGTSDLLGNEEDNDVIF